MPASIFAPLSLAIVTGVAAACILLGVKAFRPKRSWLSHLESPEPWELLGLALIMRSVARFFGLDFFEGSRIAAVIQSSLGLGLILVTSYALILMSRNRFGDRTRDHYAESVITTGTISMIIWAIVIEPVLRINGYDISLGPAGAIDVTAALLLACMAIHLTASFEDRPPAFIALAVGMSIPVAAAIVSFVGDFAGKPEISSMAAAMAVLPAMLIGVAALEPTMSDYENPAGPAGARLNRLRLVNLVLPVILGPALLTIVLLNIVVLSPAAMAAYSIALSILVVAHLIGMVQSRASSSHWASHDKLTGLPNRALFRERAALALDRSRNLDNAVAIMYLDLDRFKHINDSMGHEVGDQLLEQVARRILSCVDATDTVARLGGDEFAILLPVVDDDEVPAMLARRLLQKFSTPFNLKPRPVFMSPSIGIAMSEPTTSLKTLLTQADTAMYRAKESGRNNFAIWSKEMNEASKQRLMLETHLHSAISNNELRLVYQPKVNLQSGRVVGVEALVRWHHPSLGPISPDIFITLAEESGLIHQIGQWVLENACAQGRMWHRNGFDDLTIAVNLSTRQFQGNGNIADLVSAVLRQSEMMPELLELELTESVAMSGDELTLGILGDLRRMGVRCTIDDFGTGYSNLSYLSRFPIDALKIDKAFVGQIDKSGGDATIVVAIIAMAHGLGLKVVAEGVETNEQAEFLADQGCDEMQGFLFSKPVAAEELENLLMLEQIATGPGRLGLNERNESSQSRRLERAQPARERIMSARNSNEDEMPEHQAFQNRSWP